MPSRPADRRESETPAFAVTLEWVADIDAATHAGVVDLLDEVARHERNMGFNEPLDRETAAEVGDALKADVKNGAVMVAREGDRIVGTVALAPNKLPARCHVVEIKRCVIARSHRGRILLRAWRMILEKCRERGWSTIVIDVRTDYAATVALWRKLGFIEFGRLPRYAIMDGEEVDGVFMYFDVLAS